jgi:hypothetical protein
MAPIRSVPPFAQQVSDPCPVHARLALALAAEFDAVSAERAARDLDELAAELLVARRGAPREQLTICAEAAATHLAPVDAGGALDDLLLHRVLRGRAGHPLALAIAIADAGRRAGLPLGILGSGVPKATADGEAVVAPQVVSGEWYVAHAALPEARVLDPGGRGELVDLAGREHEFGWLCAHQTSGGLLEAIARRAERLGHLPWELRAAELRVALFADPVGRACAQRELEHVRARLN